MAVTATNIYASGATSTNSITTPSLSFSANKLGLVAVLNDHGSATPNEPTVSGASRTFTKVATKLDATSRHRVTVFRTLSGSANSGALTIDFGGQTQANAKYSADEFDSVYTLGTNGSGAVVQGIAGTNSGTQTGITLTLGTFAASGNATYGVLKKSTTSAVTAGSGFTALTNDTGLFTDTVEWKDSNDTSVDWSWGSESAIAVSIALEIRTQAAVTDISLVVEQTTANNNDFIYGTGGADEAMAQTFSLASGITCPMIEVKVGKNSTVPSDSLVVRVETTSEGLPTGTLVDANATVTIIPTTLPDSVDWQTVVFPSTFTLSASTTYAIVCQRSGSRDTSNYYIWHINTGGGYAGGSYLTKAGGSWGAGSEGGDTDFRIYRNIVSSVSPSISPSASPSISPSASPSASLSPSISPSVSPSISPSTSPSLSPSISPSASPSFSPSISPSFSSSISPSESPSISPSISPSVSPSESPSTVSSFSPSASPSLSPSISSSESPSVSPSPPETWIIDQQHITAGYTVYWGDNSYLGVGQTFMPTKTASLKNIRVKLAKNGSPTDGVSLSIYTAGIGAPGSLLGTSEVTVSGAGLSTSFSEYDFSFASGPILNHSTTYWMVLSRTGAQDGDNHYMVMATDSNSDAYTRGVFYVKDGVSSWSTYGGEPRYDDMYFIEYYDSTGGVTSSSISSSVSPSTSPSPSLSASPSISPSVSISPSTSPSISPSASPSPSPGWQDYTKGDYVSLPATNDILETSFTAGEITEVETSDDSRVSQSATGEFAIHQFKDYVGMATKCTIFWEGQTNLLPAVSSVYLQVFNVSTGLWDTLDSNSTASINTDFYFTVGISNLDDYRQGGAITCRVYQEGI